MPRFFDVTAVAKFAGNVVEMGAYQHNAQLILPLADAGGPYVANEGSPIPLDGGGSTSASGIVAYAWDCTDDGAIDATSAT